MKDKDSLLERKENKNSADYQEGSQFVDPPGFHLTSSASQIQMKEEEEEEKLQLKTAPFQMKEEEEEEEEKLQLKAAPFQMKEEEEEKLQLKAAPFQMKEEEKEEKTTSASKQSLPENVQAKMESSFGTDFSDINIYSDSSYATNLGAQAYAQGKDIHFAPGKYAPHSQSGQELLGHELTHVMQQKAGRVQANTQHKGENVNNDPSLENEADQMGSKAARGESASLITQDQNNGSDIIQGNFFSNLFGSSGKSKKYNEAISRHKKNIKKVKGIVKTMKSGNEIERNSAEWVEDGRTPFFVGTMTHDSAKRAKKITGKDGKLAYFGSKTPSDKYPSDSATYSMNINSNADIITANATTVGLNWGTKFNVLDPIKKGYSDAYVKETIIHEVQHTADRHHDEKGYSTGGASKAWVRYKTEFRSYWVEQGSHDTKSTRSGTGTGGFDNAKQQSIFNSLYSGYDYVKSNYDADSVVSTSENASENNKKFKELVKAYSKPEGINLTNSIRVDDFYKALESCKKTMTLEDNSIKELFKAVNNLTISERMSILSGEDKTRLRSMMVANLAEKIKSKVEMLLTVGDFNVGRPDGGVYA